MRFVVKPAFWNHSDGGVVGPKSEILALSLREREIFLAWRRVREIFSRREGERYFLVWFVKKREKKIWFDIWGLNGITCRLFLRSKLVIFNNFWTCLVFPQISGEVFGIYPFLFYFLGSLFPSSKFFGWWLIYALNIQYLFL